MLIEKRYTDTEWNNDIMPLVESGILVEEKQATNSFLMIYQKFFGVLKDKSGNRFACTGWQTPKGELYVNVKRM